MTLPITYEAAFNELQGITTAIQGNKVSVDELAEKVTRASQLVQICQQKLDGAEAQINAVIEGLNPGEKIDQPF
jgi:exodeoxyribonuclease VII small subunit